jgi:hypothetical protein
MGQTRAMPEQQLDPRKVRIGLAIIVVTVVIAVVLLAVVDSTLVRAVMAGIAVLGIVRAFLLYRSIRAEHAGP